jgi:glutaminase
MGPKPTDGRLRHAGRDDARGLDETSGNWLLDVGMPGKTGIGGGIVTVSPGKGVLGAFSPLLDPEGNSVRGGPAART